MATTNWGNDASPVVVLRTILGEKSPRGHTYATEPLIEWRGPYIWNLKVGDTVRINIHFSAETHRSHQKFKAKIERLDAQNKVIETIAAFDKAYQEPAQETESVDIQITSQLLRLRITAQIFDSFTLGTGSETWYPEEANIYTAFVQLLGDFSLSYVPITILYCPPDEDMTNALECSESYGTVVTLGDSELVGTRSASSASVRGGVGIKAPYAEMTGSYGESSSDSQSIENTSRNSVEFNYTWKTILIADNQRAIGRAFWGPLGDIFVLLKNPWFTLMGDETGTSLAVNERLTNRDTEVLILPAHKLLRPGDDPVALRIPAETRRKILQLDPFITNLNDFFPQDKNYPLHHAANPYADPSVRFIDFTIAHVDPLSPVGSGVSGERANQTRSDESFPPTSPSRFLEGYENLRRYMPTNRATLLARYGISGGVEIDMSAVTDISVADAKTNETVYLAEVEKKSGFSSEFNILGFFSLGTGIGGSKTEFVRVSYQSSREARIHFTKTARCSLIRTQTVRDLRDIELWWDKQFSTFMFRLVQPEALMLHGSITLANGNMAHNVMVELIAKEIDGNPATFPSTGFNPYHYATTTDHKGNFSFNNILFPGKYLLRCGNKSHSFTVTKEDISQGRRLMRSLTGVKRELDLQKSALWELAEVLESSSEQTLKLQSRLKKVTMLNEKALTKILSQAGLSFDKVSKFNTFKYPSIVANRVAASRKRQKQKRG